MSGEENDDDPTHESGEGDDAEEHIELTPKQKAALRVTLESIQRRLPLGGQLPAFAFPGSVLKNITAISRIGEIQQARMAKPLLEAQTYWQKQLAVINSDIFKSQALAQSNLNLIAAQLTRNLDFGLTESAAKLVEKFVEQQTTWLTNVSSAYTSAYLSFYPPNLRTIKGLKFEQIEQVIMVDGIPLYCLPRASTAEALLHAEGAGKRREILGRRWKTISADSRAAVDGLTSEAVSPYIPFAMAILDALDAGHPEAAQALAGSLVDAILSAYFGQDRPQYTPDRRGKRTKDAYNKFNVRQFIAFAPIWQAYQQFHAADGDKVPATFSRNATAHTVSPRQFNRRNAVQGVMIASSLLCRLDEEALMTTSD